MSERTDYSVSFSVSLSVAEAQMLRELMERTGLSRSALIRMAIRLLYANKDKIINALGIESGEKE